MRKGIERVKTSLEIDEDIDLHIKGWILQRLGWGLLLTFIVLAAVGFFGDGAMSSKRLTEGEIALMFEQYARRDSETELAILAPAVDGKLRLTLSPDFHETFEIQRITPEPESQVMEDGSTLYNFPCTGQCQITLFLNVRKKEVGESQSAITVNSREFVLNNFIYP